MTNQKELIPMVPGDLLRYEREKKGLTLDRVAELSRTKLAVLIAIENGDTGDIVWNFQFVHNDFWDFDTPAQPTLFELQRDGQLIPAVAQATKMGFVFILNRETGEPLFPIEERPVPPNPDFPELVLSPTQPFPILPKPVAQNSLDPDDSFGLTFWDAGKCKEECSYCIEK